MLVCSSWQRACKPENLSAISLTEYLNAIYPVARHMLPKHTPEHLLKIVSSSNYIVQNAALTPNQQGRGPAHGHCFLPAHSRLHRARPASATPHS
eukprot:411049-Pelagomonas_calceolata.AAC.1